MVAMIAMMIHAFIMVESSGNDLAVGDGGRAIGCLQITERCLEDVNRIERVLAKKSGATPRQFTPSDRLDRKKSIEMAETYLSWYAKDYERKTGRKATPRILSLIWNAGPYSQSKIPITEHYWCKVKSVLHI